jgi:hypothetical protein
VSDETKRKTLPCEVCGEPDARFIGRTEERNGSGWICVNCEAELFVFSEAGREVAGMTEGELDTWLSEAGREVATQAELDAWLNEEGAA